MEYFWNQRNWPGPECYFKDGTSKVLVLGYYSTKFDGVWSIRDVEISPSTSSEESGSLQFWKIEIKCHEWGVVPNKVTKRKFNKKWQNAVSRCQWYRTVVQFVFTLSSFNSGRNWLSFVRNEIFWIRRKLPGAGCPLKVTASKILVFGYQWTKFDEVWRNYYKPDMCNCPAPLAQRNQTMSFFYWIFSLWLYSGQPLIRDI